MLVYDCTVLLLDKNKQIMARRKIIKTRLSIFKHSFVVCTNTRIIQRKQQQLKKMTEKQAKTCRNYYPNMTVYHSSGVSDSPSYLVFSEDLKGLIIST